MKHRFLLLLLIIASSAEAQTSDGLCSVYFSGRSRVEASVSGDRVSSYGFVQVLDNFGTVNSGSLTGTHSITANTYTNVTGVCCYDNTLSDYAVAGYCYAGRLDAQYVCCELSICNISQGWGSAQACRAGPITGCESVDGCPSGGSDCTPSEIDPCGTLDQQPPADTNPGGGSPIIINLGDGRYELSGVDDPVWFDIAVTGTPVKMAWTTGGSDVGFLVADRNGNRTIDNGSELFGNHTPMLSRYWARNGFVALREYDSNHDGLIDARDPIWSNLMLWVDRNHDGMSTADELLPLSRSSIIAIDLGYHFSGRRDQNGNYFRYESTVRMTKDGHVITQPIYDVFFHIAE